MLRPCLQPWPGKVCGCAGAGIPGSCAPAAGGEALCIAGVPRRGGGAFIELPARHPSIPEGSLTAAILQQHAACSQHWGQMLCISNPIRADFLSKPG